MVVVREKVLKSAEKLVARGKIEAGIKEYKKVLGVNPNDISTLNRVGDLYARLNQNDEAIELFTQIAENYSRDGFFVKAIAIYKKIIKIDPTRLSVYEQLAELYHRQGLVNEARTQYQVLADYYLKHDDDQRAVAIFEKMVELEPDDPSHHAKLAELYQRQGALDRAIAEYRTIAELMLTHGHQEQAAQVYERALAVDSSDVGFITDAVLKLKEAGQMGRAARFLAVAVEHNPEARRVARLVGLERDPGEGTGTGVIEGAATGEERPGGQPEPPKASVAPPAVAAEPPAAPEELTLDPVEESRGEGDRWPEDRAEDRARAQPVEVALGTDEPEDGSLDLADLELDLDDEPSSYQVAPPPDMEADAERPGAAWQSADSAPAARESEAEASPAETARVALPTVEPPELETGEFVLDLDLEAGDEALLAQAPEPAAELEAEADEEPATTLDHDFLERTAAELRPEETREPQVDDLFTEAEVLAKYGIAEKALERLADLLQIDPDHLPSYQLMVHLHLDQERHDRVLPFAREMQALAGRLGDAELWPETVERLEEAGYRVEEEGITPPAGVADAGRGAPGGFALGLGDLEDEAPAEWDADGGGSAGFDLVEAEPELDGGSPEDLARVAAEAVSELEAADLLSAEPSPEAPPEDEAGDDESLVLDLDADLDLDTELELDAEADLAPEADLGTELELDPDLELEPIAVEGADLGAAPEEVVELPEPSVESEAEALFAEAELEALPEEPAPFLDPAADLEPEASALEEVALEEEAPEEAAPEETTPEEPAAEAAFEAPEPDAASAAGEGPLPARRHRPSRDVESVLAELAAEALSSKTRRRKAVTLHGTEPAPGAAVPREPAAAASAPPASSPPAPPAAVARAPEPAPAPPSPSPPPPAARRLDPLQELGMSLKEEVEGTDPSELDALRRPGVARGTGLPPVAIPTDDPRAMTPAEPPAAGPDWLDQVDDPSQGGEEMFEGEDDFFDLGAELEEELSAADRDQDAVLASSGEQSLEDIVEGFKRGVAESLSTEDFDTHFNLGIAYREMGLQDEAIGEFQLSAKSPDHLVDSASMLGLCFLEKGMPDLALKWYRRGIEAPGLSEEDQLGLLYDMGAAQLAAGDREGAYQSFVEIYGIKSHYRDVVARLAELDPNRGS